jgi:hypothetical protein
MRRLRLQQLTRYAVITLAVLSIYYLLKSDKPVAKRKTIDEDLIKIEKNVKGIDDVQAKETKKIEHLVRIA